MVIVLLSLAGSASAAVGGRLSFATTPRLPTGICGNSHACPARPRGTLALDVGQRAVAAELTSESLPIAVTVTGCSRAGRAQVQCNLVVGPVTYGPLGCVPNTACSPPQTINSQVAQMFARRIGRDRVLVWYGPGKPEGINYIAAL